MTIHGIYTLTNCTILTVDAQDAFYPDGALVVENGSIKAVGHREEIPHEGEVEDMNGALLLPGLINTHTHSHSSIFRNSADDMRLMDWLQKAMWPMEKHLSGERAYAATAMSCVEYIRSGITCYADQFYFAGTIARAAQTSGLRCFLAATVFEKPSPETADTLGAAVDFIERWQGKEAQTLVYPCIGPHAPYSVSPDQFRKIAELARKKRLLIHTHISETQDENVQIQEKWGMSPTRWLESLGVLEQPVLAAHSIHLSEEDMNIYAANKVRVSYNPVSNLKLVSGVMPLKPMREKGILISIGTDGAQSNNSMDLFRDLRTGALIQKMRYGDAAFFTARESVRMATIEGSKALGMEQEIGSLEPNKRADIIAMDAESPRLCPLHRNMLQNLYATISYSVCGADVTHMMVDGRWVMKDRRILTMDEAVVRKAAQEASEYLIINK